MEVLLSDSYESQDKTQDYTVLLQAGRQRLNGAHAEKLVRHLPNTKAVSQRRQRQNIPIKGLIEQLKDPSGIVVIPGLMNQLNTEVETTSVGWSS